MTKVCTKCKKEKQLSEFNKEAKGRLGRAARCRECHAAAMKEYNARPDIREKNRLEQQYRDRLKPNYVRHHLEKSVYDDMYTKFDGLCWTCKKEPAQVIDHDHSCCPSVRSCGKCVRGLLCMRCNVAIGMIWEDTQTLKRMVEYLLQ